MIIRSTLLYELDCWLIKKTHAQRMLIAKMRMTRWMCGHMRLDRIRNEGIKDKVEVTLIEEKMRKTKPRRFDNVNRSVNAPVSRCETISLLECRRGRGRPMKSWNEVIKQHLNLFR